MAEVVDISVWAQAVNDCGARRGINGEALGAGGDFAVVADSDAGALAPDKGPPRAGGNGAQDGAFFGAGLLPSGGWGGAEFAMDFLLVDVGQELVEQAVSAFEFQVAVRGQEGRQAVLPVVVAAFDFAFGLGRGRVAEFDAVEWSAWPSWVKASGTLVKKKEW